MYLYNIIKNDLYYLVFWSNLRKEVDTFYNYKEVKINLNPFYFI
jgi:hypothetical protein